MSDNDKDLEELLKQLEGASGGKKGGVPSTGNPMIDDALAQIVEVLKAVENGDMEVKEAVQSFGQMAKPYTDMFLSSPMGEMQAQMAAAEVFQEIRAFADGNSQLSGNFNASLLDEMPPQVVAQMVEALKVQAIAKTPETIQRNIDIYSNMPDAVVEGYAKVVYALMPSRLKQAGGVTTEQACVEDFKKVVDLYKTMSKEDLVQRSVDMIQSIDTQLVVDLVEEYRDRLTEQNLQNAVNDFANSITQQDIEAITVGLVVGVREVVNAAAATGEPQKAQYSAQAQNFIPAVANIIQKFEDSLERSGMLLTAEKAQKYKKLLSFTGTPRP